MVVVELKAIEGDHEAGESVEEDTVGGEATHSLGDIIEDDSVQAFNPGQRFF